MYLLNDIMSKRSYSSNNLILKTQSYNIRKTSSTTNLSLIQVNSKENKSLSDSFSNNTHSNYFEESENDCNIKVVCRIRPFNNKEISIGEESCINVDNNRNLTIKIKAESKNSKETNFPFAFDRIFDSNSTQREIFDEVGSSVIDSVMNGYNGTMMAYGQTSSGKSFTMSGVLEDNELKGIIPRIVEKIYLIIASNDSVEYNIKVSLCEIYQEKLKDLLDTSKTNLNIREEKSKGVYIENLTEEDAYSTESVMNIIKKGINNRIVSSTNMNETSSRSHLLVIFTVSQFNSNDLSKKTGKLFLVDLAGSEKISKTGAVGQTLEEAKGINKSLTALGMVINALTEKNKRNGHIPYRDSKLTRILSESLGGNSKTSLIITLSPSSFNDSESLSSLRFGMRAKKVKNNAKVNKDISIQELKLEIDKLNIQSLKYQWKVDKLEEYIKLNGLRVPYDSELEDLDNKDSNKLNYTIKEEAEDLEQTILCHKQSKPLLAVDRTKEQNNEINLVSNIKEINEIENIKVKYVEMLYIMNQIEDEKEEMKEEIIKLNSELTRMSTVKKNDIIKEIALTIHSNDVSINNSSMRNKDTHKKSQKSNIDIDENYFNEEENKQSIIQSNLYASPHILDNNNLIQVKNELIDIIDEIFIDIGDLSDKYANIEELSEIIRTYKQRLNKVLLKPSLNKLENKQELPNKEEILKELEIKANRLINNHIKNKPGIGNVIYNSNFVKWNMSNFKNKFKNLK